MATAPSFPHWLAREERQAERHPVRLTCIASGTRMCAQLVEMTDLSPLGCRLRVAEPLAVGSYVTLVSGSAARLEGWVAWSRASECGIDFAHQAPDAVVEQIAGRGPH